MARVTMHRANRACVFEKIIHTFERCLLHSIEIAESLSGNSRNHLHIKFRRGLFVIVVGEPFFKSPSFIERNIEKRVVGT